LTLANGTFIPSELVMWAASAKLQRCYEISTGWEGSYNECMPLMLEVRAIYLAGLHAAHALSVERTGKVIKHIHKYRGKPPRARFGVSLVPGELDRASAHCPT